MKGKYFSIGYYEYVTLYQVLHSLKVVVENKALVLSGIKQIPPELVSISLLKDRYLFKYDAEKTYEGYGMRKDFSLEIYQLAALAYTLEDLVELPIGLNDLVVRLNKTIKPFTYEAVRSKFQIYYEANLMQEYGWSYTELREQCIGLYDLLLDDFLEIPTP